MKLEVPALRAPAHLVKLVPVVEAVPRVGVSVAAAPLMPVAGLPIESPPPEMSDHAHPLLSGETLITTL